MFDIYRIDKHDTNPNSHKTNRDETWNLIKDKSFETEKEAELYVIKMNRHENAVDLGLTNCTDNEEISFRCLDKQYASKQTYFIGRPPINLIKSQLKQRGITIYSSF